ncbi:MAG: hypothetical protein QXH03_10895 [Candidatus Bathyarchaeia archaeon]
MSFAWEREYLKRRVEELKEYLNKNKEKEYAFLVEKLIELYEFELYILKYR